MKWDKTVFRNTYDTVIKVIETSQYVYVLTACPTKRLQK